MENPWFLMICSCGRYFGRKMGQNTNCPMCDSTSSKQVEKYPDPMSLAKAVSQANLPEAISKELMEKETKKFHRKKDNMNGGKNNFLISAMKRSTDQDGTLTMDSLVRELRSSGSDDVSAELLIGQGELEGKLIKTGRQSWKWL